MRLARVQQQTEHSRQRDHHSTRDSWCSCIAEESGSGGRGGENREGWIRISQVGDVQLAQAPMTRGEPRIRTSHHIDTTHLHCARGGDEQAHHCASRQPTRMHQ